MKTFEKNIELAENKRIYDKYVICHMTNFTRLKINVVFKFENYTNDVNMKATGFGTSN